MSRRTERIASTIRQELAMIMLRELNDPRLIGMPSITRVKVSPDLSVADVYITVMGTPAQQNMALNALKHSAGALRVRLMKMISLRQAPFLKFHIDENLKKELQVLDLLHQVAQEREAGQHAADTGEGDQSQEPVETSDASDEADPQPSDQPHAHHHEERDEAR